MNPGVLEPRDLENMNSDDIILKIVKLYQDGMWNECKNFMYLSMKKSLFDALGREEQIKEKP
jgi:hypothetical protein